MAHYIVMWMHVAGVSGWIGSMLFTVFALRPAVRRFGGIKEAGPLIKRIEDRARTIRWMSIITLILTGFFNLLYEGGTERIESIWGAILMVKIGLAGVAMSLAGVADFILSQGPGRLTTGGDLRTQTWLHDGTLALALLILFIGVYLSRS